MTKTIRGTYHAGRIELLEPLELPDGSELMVSVTTDEPASAKVDATSGSAGAWARLLDCEAFEKEVYENRLLTTRPSAKL
jgi:hypothetical protein